jgi:pimeloyl-ACP methyl ester carboxylesterase
MATYVLVPGGGHGGWCYQHVARLLRAQGHEVYTPTLSGVGDRAHTVSPKVDLDVHIQDVVALLRFEDLRDVILIGHSYGGMVVTGVVDREPDRVGRLVYLDAADPSDGQSLADRAPELMAYAHSGMQVVDGVELVLFPDDTLLRVLGVTDPDLKAWVTERLTPHPWACFTQPLRLQDPARRDAVAQYHILCSSTVATRDPAMIERARAAGRLWTVDTGHDLMLTEPRAVADALLEVAAD